MNLAIIGNKKLEENICFFIFEEAKAKSIKSSFYYTFKEFIEKHNFEVADIVVIGETCQEEEIDMIKKLYPFTHIILLIDYLSKKEKESFVLSGCYEIVERTKCEEYYKLISQIILDIKLKNERIKMI